MASDDEFDDSQLSGQDMIDALDHTQRLFHIPFPSSTLNCAPRGKLKKMACDQQAELPVLNDEFDFTDPAIVAALKNAETHVVNTEPQTRSGDEVIALTRAELEAIKRNAFSAGRKMARKDSSRFPFLDLPAELRVIIYTHYFTDRNPLTAGHQASALPNRLSDTQHCCSSTNTWCKTVRPLISTNLILTCKQIYHEARDDFLYKGRRFKASVGRFDVEFKAIRPHLRFWQYMQHLDLEINPAMNMSARYETGNLIVHLVALLRGGQNLRSFRLKYAATERAESIMRFKDLNVNGAVSLTQVFKGWFEPDEKDVVRKKERLERLLFSILGCASYDAPPYDFLTSTKETTTDVVNLDLDVPSFEMYITITTGFD